MDKCECGMEPADHWHFYPDGKCANKNCDEDAEVGFESTYEFNMGGEPREGIFEVFVCRDHY